MNNPSISYCLAVWNEHLELKRLTKQLLEYIQPEDEIIIQGDQGKVTDEVLSVIRPLLKNKQISYIEYPLRRDFAAFKNNMLIAAKKDYIFLIDADELIHPVLLENVKDLLVENSEIEMFVLPRVNVVKGLTPEYVKSQGWNVQKIQVPLHDEYSHEILHLYDLTSNIEVVNPFDWQQRIWKNSKLIRYEGSVHERINGYKNHSVLPVESDFSWCIFHIKEIERQKRQNNFYQTNF